MIDASDVLAAADELDRHTTSMVRSVRSLLESTASRALDDARSNAPRRTGRLARSVDLRFDSDLEANIGTDLNYAMDVHNGTSQRSPAPFIDDAAERHAGRLERWEPGLW